jgi:hypothetical protein
MECKFDPNICSVECKKYAICSYYSTQKQLSDIQSQLNFIYETLGKILKSNETADLKLEMLQSAVYKFVCNSNDSEPI